MPYFFSLAPTYSSTSNNAHYDTEQRLQRLMWANMAQVNIYFDDASVIEYREVKASTISDLLSNIGGTCGLWVGISFITLIEFVCLPIYLIMECIKRSKRNKVEPAQNVTNQNPEPRKNLAGDDSLRTILYA